LWRSRFNPAALPLQPISSRRRGKVPAGEEEESHHGCREKEEEESRRGCPRGASATVAVGDDAASSSS
jgi:hypothetical protein